MIKATKGLSPLFVRYYDSGAGSIYNLTKDQYDKLIDTDEDYDKVLEKFEVELDYELGYVPDVTTTLAKIYGFEVDSE